VRVARQYGIGYLQMAVMERQRLIERHARSAGLGDVTVVWHTIGDPAAGNDAMLAGDVDFVAGGLGSFTTLWDRTRGTLGVKAVAALDSMPMLLNTRDPALRSIRDLGPDHRIAIPGVKVSSQATTLQFAAAQAFGADEWQRLDRLTVGMAHPTGMQALLAERSEIVAHFTSPPYQYEELRHPGVHTLLNSYDVWGGPQTFVLAWTTARFRADNPKLYAAFLAALRDATAFINANRHKAAALYVAVTGDRTISVDRLAVMLADPQLQFTLVPQNVVKFVQFKVRIGSVRTLPESWKDLFFPDVHDLPGS
jgi:NitT/TauT family transport system substrate-binding protein